MLECCCVVFSTCIWTARTRVRLYFFVQSRLHVFAGMWIPLSDSSEILENVQWALRKSARTLRPVARFREILCMTRIVQQTLHRASIQSGTQNCWSTSSEFRTPLCTCIWHTMEIVWKKNHKKENHWLQSFLSLAIGQVSDI